MSTGLNSFDASKFLLSSLATVCGVASLLTFLATRRGSSPPRPVGRTFLASVAALAISYQFHLLSETSTRIPSGYGRDVYRWECLRSGKGGKRPFGDASDEYRNPCYNRTSAMNKTDADEMMVHEALADENEYRPSSLCPSASTHDDASAIEPFVPVARDCARAQSGRCGTNEPCTPCELSRRDEFYGSAHGWTRCRACSAMNGHGECGFVVGVGPYCWKDAAGWEAVPCERCCTEGVPMHDGDGVCY